jgi:hypothetical protein
MSHVPGRRLLAGAVAVLLALLVRVPAVAQADHDMDEIAHYTLTMDKVTRLGQAFADLGAYAKQHPESQHVLETDTEKQENLDNIARRISSLPPVVTILSKNGFSPREFIVAEMTLMQIAMAVAMKPADEPDAKYAAEIHANPANLAFAREHKAELEAMQAKMGSGSN